MMNLLLNASSAVTGFRLEPMEFVKNLSYMGTGMLSIFIVIGVIILATVVLDKSMKALEKKKK